MKALFTALVLLPLLSGAATADCSRDSAPEIPDGAKATEAEMVAAQQAIKTYVASSEGYIACLDEEGKAAGEEEPAEAKVARVQSQNAVVDEMTEVAAKFNEEIKAFKAAQ